LGGKNRRTLPRRAIGPEFVLLAGRKLDYRICMAISPGTSFLAVDGGGTGCRLALVCAGVRHDHAGGPANVFTDFSGAIGTIRDALAGLAAKAGITIDAILPLPAHLGLAGITDDRDAEKVRAALPLTNATVGNDRQTALRGAFGAGDGTLVALGTGSFVARQIAGESRIVGGWGACLGDEASGFWISRRALSATLAAEDGLAPDTRLTRALLTRFSGQTARLIEFASRAAPGEVAALAPMVADAAAEGDETGLAIMKDAAAFVLTTAAAIGWRPDEPICLIGGASESVAAYLPAKMLAGRVAPLGTALDGALDLARSNGRQP
jgi:glucosamine kinase